MRRLGHVGALCALILSCDAPWPPPRPAGEPPPGTAADCASACARLRALGCPEGSPTPGPDGKPGTGDESSCEATCADVEASGYTTLNPACVAKIGACAQIDTCGWSAE